MSLPILLSPVTLSDTPPLDLDLRRRKELQILVHKLGLTATETVNWSLLDLALTHPSFSGTHNYEQLEFLGDSVVRLIAAELLLESAPGSSVGEHSAIRSVLVSDRFLSELTERLGLTRHVLISPSVSSRDWQADVFEAILGALYLSTGNTELIRPWLDELLLEKAAIVRQDPALENYKDALQSWTQANFQCLPEYKTRLYRPEDEDQQFISEVWLKDQALAQGIGRSKKNAEQAAAKLAFSTHVQSALGTH
ncbi:MAG: ribonuclease III [Cyanobacteria bacterium P01_H01_bin.15]